MPSPRPRSGAGSSHGPPFVFDFDPCVVAGVEFGPDGELAAGHVVDEYTRESLSGLVACSIDADATVAMLDEWAPGVRSATPSDH
jgi:hypothetical protein